MDFFDWYIIVGIVIGVPSSFIWIMNEHQKAFGIVNSLIDGFVIWVIGVLIVSFAYPLIFIFGVMVIAWNYARLPHPRDGDQ